MKDCGCNRNSDKWQIKQLEAVLLFVATYRKVFAFQNQVIEIMRFRFQLHVRLFSIFYSAVAIVCGVCLSSVYDR